MAELLVKKDDDSYQIDAGVEGKGAYPDWHTFATALFGILHPGADIPRTVSAPPEAGAEKVNTDVQPADSDGGSDTVPAQDSGSTEAAA